MDTLQKPVTIEVAQRYIEQLDFNYIINTMCSTKYFLPVWERNDAVKCAILYKNFLLLQKKHLPISLVPTREIDEFWHNHILHTKKYQEDCQAIFGHYLHHSPASENDSMQQLIDDYLKTKQLYLREFGVPLDLICV